MHYDARYHEEVRLSDGTTVALRLIRHDDKARLVAILAGLSLSSRVMRFFMPRRDLSARELRHLTELDGVDHLAILALRGAETLGVARFVRQAPGSDVAEPAIAIVDRCHRRGLGRILLARLVDAARERGIGRFEGEVLPHNRPMLRLLHGAGGSAERASSWAADSVTCRLDLGVPWCTAGSGARDQRQVQAVDRQDAEQDRPAAA